MDFSRCYVVLSERVEFECLESPRVFEVKARERELGGLGARSICEVFERLGD